jgi:hypothetical protein
MHVGKTLYHGTTQKLPSGFPNKPDGNWFATDPMQAILHAVVHAGRNANKVPYLYIYKVTNSPRIIKFASPNNFNTYAKSLGFKLPNGKNTFTFASLNYNIAKRLCQNNLYDGWWFPADQTQVMLCNPSKFLKLVKILRISRPPGVAYRLRFNNGMWKRKNNKNKISTVSPRKSAVNNHTRLAQRGEKKPNTNINSSSLF